MAKSTGRPTIYTDELADEICNAIATSSKGLIGLCAENPHWPSRETIYAWKRSKQNFSDKYMKAKADQVEVLVDECLEISDNCSRDTTTKTNANGEQYEVCNTEWINRSRLRIDTRKWFACKLAPKIYGEKLQIDGSLKRDDELLKKAKENASKYAKKSR